MKQQKESLLARQQRKRQEDTQRQQQLHRLLQEAEPQFIHLLQQWLEQEKLMGADANRNRNNKP